MSVRSDLEALTAKGEEAVRAMLTASNELHQIAGVVRGKSLQQQLTQMGDRLEAAAQHLAVEVRASDPKTMWQLLRSGAVVAFAGSALLQTAAGAAGGVVGAEIVQRYEQQLDRLLECEEEVGDLTSSVLGNRNSLTDNDLLVQIRSEFELIAERIEESLAKGPGQERLAAVATDRLRERSHLVEFLASMLRDTDLEEEILEPWNRFKTALDQFEDSETVTLEMRELATLAREAVVRGIELKRDD